MYDAIIVGARCAGASTAMLLARAGCKVLLVDRARFPKDLPHGHFIHRHGPARLKRWGLLDRIVATGCPPVTSMTTDFGETPLTGRNLSVDDVALGYGPRRAALDKVLVDAAVEAGATLREGLTVETFTTDGDRITGIRGRASGQGSPVEERASMVVGADGRNSRLAHFVGAPRYEETPPLTYWCFSYFSDVQSDGLEIAVRNGKVLFAFPTNDRLLGLFIGFSTAAPSDLHEDVEGRFMAAVDEVPGLAGRVRAGRRVERFYGMADVPNFLRKPFGPGWALVGDAGCHKDPFLALGICDAFRDAEMLAEAIAGGLSGGHDLMQALADFGRKRDEATLNDYRQNVAMAQFKPLPAEIEQLRAALRDNRKDTDLYYMAIEGMIPQQTFFDPRNVQRIIATAKAGT